MTADTLAIIAALPIEAKSLVSQKVAVGQTLQLSEHTWLHVSGMGAARARAGALHMLGVGASALVSWGTAAGLDSQIAPGRLLLPVRIMDQQQRVFEVDRPWRDQLHAALGVAASVTQSPLLQVDRLIDTIAEKRQLFVQYQAAAIDMESAAIAAVAQQEGMRFIAVRSVVDNFETAMPPWLSKSLDSSGQIQHWELVKGVCRRPLAIYELIRITQAFAAAKAALQLAAKFIDHPLPSREIAVESTPINERVLSQGFA